MIKNIVFDMGNVLILFDADRILSKYLSSQEDIEIFKREVIGSLEWREYDRGTIEKKDFQSVCDRVPPHIAELVKKTVMHSCFARCEMPPFPETETLVRELKANGYKIYLLSNAGQDFYYYSKFIPALTVFDFCFVSSDYRLLKPEPEIYEKFFAVTGLDRSECVFIDDVKTNIDASEKAGMKGVCFTPSRQDISVLRKRLRELGVDCAE